VFAQQEPLFNILDLEGRYKIRLYEILPAKGGFMRLSTSAGIIILKHERMLMFPENKTNRNIKANEKAINNYRDYETEDSIRAMAETQDGTFYFATNSNNIVYIENSAQRGFKYPPYVFSPKGVHFSGISKLYIDNNKDLFIGTKSDNFYYIKDGANTESFKNAKIDIIDSVPVVLKGEKQVKKITLAPQTGVFAFAQDKHDQNILWIGTNHGLYKYNKLTDKHSKVLPVNLSAELSFSVTHIEIGGRNDLWFSTLERGMGFYDKEKNSLYFFPYPKKSISAGTLYPIKTFCYKSDNSFFVAIMDSLPAVFSKKSGAYAFIDHEVLRLTANSTTDIKIDNLGSLFIVKGGWLYNCRTSNNSMLIMSIKSDSTLLAPFITYVSSLPAKEELFSRLTKLEQFPKLELKYYQNSLKISFGQNDFGGVNNSQFAWKIDRITAGWIVLPKTNFSYGESISVNKLKPGKYLFEVKVRNNNTDWQKQQGKMIIIINPPFWQTWLFWVLIITGITLIIFVIVKLRVRAVRKQERERAKHEKELSELEAKALRAQMNPHFIFNCMNSIKSLMQENKIDKGVIYLTTFSKLIRTLFNNADKKEISLFDEIETCKLYLQLEAMRFDTKFSYTVHIDEKMDLKSIQVPALIVQPFIENAIWHGIVPKEESGYVELSVIKKENLVEIIIDDNGIGRDASKQNKSASALMHNSKGVNLTQSRLELDNLLRQRQAKLEIVDKKDGDGLARGTKVMITINEEAS